MVGAGLIGRRVARLLADRGDDVVLVTRRGMSLPGVRAEAADAADQPALTAAADGAETIFLASGPAAYTSEEWERSWPPVVRSAIAAAHDAGAGLVVMGNLYPYGLADGPMTEHSPERPVSAKGRVRTSGWAAVKAAHDAGELRGVEVRASDYFGAGSLGMTHLGEHFFVPILESRTARVVGDPGLPHSWSYLDDIAATLVAASDYTGPWGRVWHVPSGAPHSREEIAATLNEWFGSRGKVAGTPTWLLDAVGLFSPAMKGIAEESYQFTHPFVIDANETERMLGITATPWQTALRDTAQSYRKLFTAGN